MRENGIECPTWKSELIDTLVTKAILIYPPQKHVYCESCGFKGSSYF